MRVSKNVDLFKEPFHLNYRRVTINREWETNAHGQHSKKRSNDQRN
jgi:hypothetical protein